MNKTTKLILTFVAVAVVAGTVVLVAGNNSSTEDKETTTDTSQETAVTVTYDGNGFTPAEVTVKSGGDIKIVNQSDAKIEPSSDPHPTHTTNPELNFDDIEAGESKKVTVTTKGTWGYHNHYSPSKRGSVIVE